MATRVICFDIGGVLARIVGTWAEALVLAGIEPVNLVAAQEPFLRFEPLERYQAGALSQDGYLDALAEFLGIARGRALDAHNWILVGEYPGVLDLVRRVKAKGFVTACLSNTNEPHWEILRRSGRFPAIENLDHQFASHLLGFNKPDPAVYEAFEKGIDARGEEIVFFDDAPGSVSAARGVGWQAFAVDPGADPAAQMSTLLRDIVPSQ